MSGKLKFSNKSPVQPAAEADEPEAPVAESKSLPVTHVSTKVSQYGKGGVYRSIGGGKRVRVTS